MFCCAIYADYVHYIKKTKVALSRMISVEHLNLRFFFYLIAVTVFKHLLSAYSIVTWKLKLKIESAEGAKMTLQSHK